jgi:hypothetical protein
MSSSTSANKNEIVTDKIFSFSPSDKIYRISDNKNYLKRRSMIFSGIAFLALLATALPYGYVNIAFTILPAIISILLFYIGLRYYYQTTIDKWTITIDLKKQVVNYTHSLILPFRTIKYLSKNKLKSRFGNKQKWQINLEDHRGNPVPIIVSESESQTKKIMRELSAAMNVSIKPGN